MQINITNLTHKFKRNLLFKNLNFSAQSGQLIIVSGKNGSGKSTFLKIISGFIFPTNGSVNFQTPELQLSNRHEWIGFCSPAINLYGELSGKENLELSQKLKSKTSFLFQKWISSCGLTETDLNKPFKSYSSGMKQRIKILSSVIHQPKLLLWDEPMNNLDRDGKNWVLSVLKDIQPNTLIFLASNEEEEIELSPIQLNLDSFK